MAAFSRKKLEVGPLPVVVDGIPEQSGRRGGTLTRRGGGLELRLVQVRRRIGLVKKMAAFVGRPIHLVPMGVVPMGVAAHTVRPSIKGWRVILNLHGSGFNPLGVVRNRWSSVVEVKVQMPRPSFQTVLRLTSGARIACKVARSSA